MQDVYDKLERLITEMDLAQRRKLSSGRLLGADQEVTWGDDPRSPFVRDQQVATAGACRSLPGGWRFQLFGSASSVSMRKIGWSGAIRRSSSPGEFASSPPKNTPTSHVQRFR